MAFGVAAEVGAEDRAGVVGVGGVGLGGKLGVFWLGGRGEGG